MVETKHLIVALIATVLWLIYTRGKLVSPFQVFAEKLAEAIHRRRVSALAAQLTGHFRAPAAASFCYDLGRKTLNGIMFSANISDLAPLGPASAALRPSEHALELDYVGTGLTVEFDEEGLLSFTLYFGDREMRLGQRTTGCGHVLLVLPDQTMLRIDGSTSVAILGQYFGTDDEPVHRTESNELSTEYRYQGSFIHAVHSRDGSTLLELEFAD